MKPRQKSLCFWMVLSLAIILLIIFSYTTYHKHPDRDNPGERLKNIGNMAIWSSDVNNYLQKKYNKDKDGKLTASNLLRKISAAFMGAYRPEKRSKYSLSLIVNDKNELLGWGFEFLPTESHPQIKWRAAVYEVKTFYKGDAIICEKPLSVKFSPDIQKEIADKREWRSALTDEERFALLTEE